MYGYNSKSVGFILGILLLHQVVGLCMHGHNNYCALKGVCTTKLKVLVPCTVDE